MPYKWFTWTILLLKRYEKILRVDCRETIIVVPCFDVSESRTRTLTLGVETAYWRFRGAPKSALEIVKLSYASLPAHSALDAVYEGILDDDIRTLMTTAFFVLSLLAHKNYTCVSRNIRLFVGLLNSWCKLVCGKCFVNRLKRFKQELFQLSTRMGQLKLIFRIILFLCLRSCWGLTPNW